MHRVDYTFTDPLDWARMGPHHQAQLLAEVLTMLVGSKSGSIEHQVRTSDSGDRITIIANDEDFLASLPVSCRGFKRGEPSPTVATVGEPA